MEIPKKINWSERAAEVGKDFASRADSNDRQGRFVEENYRTLAAEGFLAALIPTEFGGGGARYGEGVSMLRELGRHCASTALSLSMHSHLVAATVWKHLRAQPGEALLRRVAAEQRVLVSTGAGDWLESNGNAERVEGGYRISGIKRFASGCPVGDIAISSIAYDCPDEGPSVLHFALPLKSEGVEVQSDWDSLGMRSTGSNSIQFQSAFVPDEAISLKRPRQGWPPVWSVVLTVAPGLFMAPYVGVAEAAAGIARDHVKRRPDTVSLLQLGEMENQLTLARMALDSLVQNARDYDFAPDLRVAAHGLTAKTLISNACIRTVDHAMEICGGAAYLRPLGLERLLRDVKAAPFHPLPDKRQQLINGRLAIGLPPV